MSEGSPSARIGAIGATVIEMVQTRMELAATELAQERLHWARQLIAVSVALWASTVGVVLIALALALASGTEYRAVVLALLGGIFLGAGAFVAWGWRNRALAKPALLQGTLDTLREDAAALRRSSGVPL
jgi:uncharacterized membrane protein YqjE